MGINRSGYYKWKSRQGKLNRYEQDRILLTQLLHEEHELHPSLGYHRLARNIFHNTGYGDRRPAYGAADLPDGGRMEAGTGTERQRQAPVPDPGAQLH